MLSKNARCDCTLMIRTSLHFTRCTRLTIAQIHAFFTVVHCGMLSSMSVRQLILNTKSSEHKATTPLFHVPHGPPYITGAPHAQMKPIVYVSYYCSFVALDMRHILTLPPSAHLDTWHATIGAHTSRQLVPHPSSPTHSPTDSSPHLTPP